MAPKKKRRYNHGNRKSRKTPVEHTGFYPYLARFLEALMVDGYSPYSLRSRDSALRRFIAWCDERGLSEPQDITKPILERYKRHLYYYRKTDGNPLSATGQQWAMGSVKLFFRWLSKENYVLYNPASEVTIPKAPPSLPKTILSQAQIKDLLNQPDINTPEGIRDRAVIELLYGTGIRRHELIQLQLHDINAGQQSLWVRNGKYNKDRVLPLIGSAAAWLNKYIWEAREKLLIDLDDTTVFVNDFGLRYSLTAMGNKVKKYLEQADIHVSGACHLLRHAMATHMLENGADIRFIQVMLGHAKLTSTEIYTRVSVQQLTAVVQATHPSAKDGPQDLG